MMMMLIIIIIIIIIDKYLSPLTLEASKKTDSYTKPWGGGGGQSDLPLILLIQFIRLTLNWFDLYNKLHLYFELSGITLYLIGFHGNNSQINDVTGSRHLESCFKFSDFVKIFTFVLQNDEENSI